MSTTTALGARVEFTMAVPGEGGRMVFTTHHCTVVGHVAYVDDFGFDQLRIALDVDAADGTTWRTEMPRDVLYPITETEEAGR